MSSKVFYLVLILRLSLCNVLYLTPYIESNRTEEARNLSAVRDLPNAPQIQSYSGFITVEKEYNSNLFFWFFPSLVSENIHAFDISDLCFNY